MQQQINFINVMPREVIKFHSRQFMLAIFGVFLLCLAYTFYLMIAQYFSLSELKKIERNRVQAAQQFQQVARTYPLLAASIPLEKKVEKLADELLAGQKEYESISHTTLRKGFSEYMLALSKLSPSGLWLTRIDIDQDVKKVSIQGKTLAPALVAILIDALNESNAFKDMYFDLFNLERDKDKKILDFEIANEELKSKQTLNQ